MPLTSIEAAQAYEYAKVNAQNVWPKRGDVDNRVEPLTKPRFTPSFKLIPRESVFTIGSCFARNVERVLETHGFDVPMRHLEIVKGTFDDMESNPNIFNNYGVPSILNELEWAIDAETSFDPDSCLLELTKDGYCDLHLTRLLKAVPREEALARRARIKEGVAKVTQCRVIVITLGLVEVWYDVVAKRYLNISPPRQAAKRFPGRFELHVLSYGEILQYLERTIALLKKFCRPDHRIVLTVSPVPLAMTFTGQDVIVANSYSKSVLRAAAQEIWTKYDHVDYFPSFESVTLSDRTLAWQEDMRHVTSELIALNVNTMVAAYSETTEASAGDTSLDLANAQSVEKTRNFEEAAALYAALVERAPDLAAAQLGLGRCLGELGKVDEAKEILSPLLDFPEVAREATLVLARVYRGNRYLSGFESIADRLRKMDSDKIALQELIAGLFVFKRLADVEYYCGVMQQQWPRLAVPYEYRGRVAIANREWSEAVKWLNEYLAVQPSVPRIFVLLGQAQKALGNIDEACDSFKRALLLNPSLRSAAEGLKELTETKVT